MLYATKENLYFQQIKRCISQAIEDLLNHTVDPENYNTLKDTIKNIIESKDIHYDRVNVKKLSKCKDKFDEYYDKFIENNAHNLKDKIQLLTKYLECLQNNGETIGLPFIRQLEHENPGFILHLYKPQELELKTFSVKKSSSPNRRKKPKTKGKSKSKRKPKKN